MKQKLEKLHLRTTGGMGITLEGCVDIASLPEDLARQIGDELTPTKLSRVARRQKGISFGPGQQQYEVTLFTGARGSPRRYAFSDQQADPELLDLLDELTAIIIEEKIRAKREQPSMEAETEPRSEDIAAQSDDRLDALDEEDVENDLQPTS